MSPTYRITNRTRSRDLATQARRANNPITRGIGLTFRKSLPVGGGLIIDPCRAVVSFFMRFAIDVLFVDRQGRIVYVLPHMKPWRASRVVRQANFVLELPAGTAQATGTAEGDLVSIQETSEP